MSDQTTMSQRDYDLGTEGFNESTRRRSKVLAERLERGARDLIALARTLTPAEWETRIPKDGRKIGVVVHHVASMYPIEIKFALILASGRPVEGVTWDDIHALNGQHAKDNDAVTKDVAIDLLRANAETARLCRATCPAGRSSVILTIIRTAYAFGSTVNSSSATALFRADCT